MMRGALGGAAAGYATGSAVHPTVGGVLGAAGGVTGGVVGAAVEVTHKAGKSVSSEVTRTSRLGRIRRVTETGRDDGYQLGDFTKGIAAKGRLARGGDVNGYQFGDFTRGLFTSSNSEAVEDGLEAETKQLMQAQLDQDIEHVASNKASGTRIWDDVYKQWRTPQ